MTPVEFPGSRWIGKPENMTEEDCDGIPADTAIDEKGHFFYVTAWKPSYEDLQALNRGEPIYIKTISKALPPMLLFTMNEDGIPNF